ncbi:MAG TPA: glycosyltransferase family 2 protein [Thermoanaerobaculia bacterium]|nr:glycosyltransferase family 2 protein [Thermoanaerobaculia bacterium]
MRCGRSCSGSKPNDVIDVSVVIPTWNRAAMVGQAVASALGPGVEVIVVDDASTDDTIERLAGCDITLLRQPTNQGHHAARNRGLEEARGEFVKFLDSDDLLEPGSLAEEVALARATRADIVASGWVDLQADGTRRIGRAPLLDRPIEDVLLAGAAVPTTAALYRRSYLERFRWNPAVKKMDDWEFWVRTVLGGGKLVRRDGIAYILREHGGERVTSAHTMLDNAHDHFIIMRELERAANTPARRKRLAQYWYKELRVCALQDRETFECELRKVFELDPHFAPRDEERQWWMRLAARLLGTRCALLLHSAVKRRIVARQ